MSELSPNYTETTQSALKAVSKKVILTNGLIQYSSACSLLNSPALPLLSEERSANFPLSKRHDQVWPAYPSLSAAMFTPTPKMSHRSCCVTSLLLDRFHDWDLWPAWWCMLGHFYTEKKDTLRKAVCLFSCCIPRSWRQNNIFAFLFPATSSSRSKIDSHPDVPVCSNSDWGLYLAGPGKHKQCTDLLTSHAAHR